MAWVRSLIQMTESWQQNGGTQTTGARHMKLDSIEIEETW